jgi:transcriptional regulator with XRE-family HTH domain
MKIVVDKPAVEIGRLLRSRRRALGVSQRDLAELSGIAVHTLSNIESGDGNPSLNVIGRILDTLGLEMVLRPRRTSEASAESLDLP